MKQMLVGAMAVGAMALTAVVVAAPASAAPPQSNVTCQYSGNATLCSSPGNAQITNAPPVVAVDGFAGGFYNGPYLVPFDSGRR